MNKKLFISAITKFLFGVLLVGLFIFLPAFTLKFVNGWIFMGVLFIPMFIAGIVMMSTSTLPTKLEFNQFTWGTFILIVAIGFALLSRVPIFLLIAENRK